MNFDTTTLVTALVGAVCGYLFAEKSRPADHPLIALVRSPTGGGFPQNPPERESALRSA